MAKLTIKKGLCISLYSILGCLALFTLLEIGLRAFEYEAPPAADPIAIWNKVEDRELSLGRGLHKFAGGQLWEPRPGAPIPSAWSDGPERVNVAGFRGPLRAREKKAGVLRIATLGDSSTFGYGVPYGECWSSVLESRLNAQGVQAEVLDFGVIGFTLLQGSERYRTRVRDFRPDVVIAAFGAVNDHSMAQGLPDARKIAQGIAGESGWRALRRRAREDLRVFQLLAACIDSSSDDATAREEQSRLEIAAASNAEHIEDPEFESRYHGVRRVSLAEFETGLAELAKLVGADGAQLILLSMPRRPGVDFERPVLRSYSQAIVDFGKAHGTLVCDGRGDFRAYREVEHGDPYYFFLDNDDYHPSKRGHARLAERLCGTVLDSRRSH